MTAAKHLALVPKSKPEKATKTVVDTIAFTQDEAKEWLLPPFQRPLKINEKVRALAEQVAADGGVLPGILTFGSLGDQRYLIDGQHRREAFILSGAEHGYADIRVCHFASLAEMGAEFVRLNSALVKMTPDDFLRGLEGMSPQLQRIRKTCPWVGYDNVRRGTRNSVLSMAVAIRAWMLSRAETPTPRGVSAATVLQELSHDEASNLIAFLTICEQTWGSDPEFHRLWGTLNITICMWMFRRLVLVQNRVQGTRAVTLSAADWKQAMAALAASSSYLDWLIGRQLSDLHRAPAYRRMQQVISARLGAGRKLAFPKPAWAHGRATNRRP